MGKTLAILAAITVLAGCAGTTPAPSRTGATPGQSPAAPVLRWLTGTDGLEMTSLLVPRDYARPAGPQLTIALARLPATDPARRLGSIVFNPGGPGIPGIDAIRYGAGTLFTPAVRARFDIVSFDPRGIGLSSPRIRCLATRPQPGQPYPRNASERAEWIAAARESDAACQSNSGDLLPFVGTENVVRDLEQIRAALGEPKLTYVGVSYGALIGTLYAERFPTQVRAMILDGPFDPALDAATEASDRAAALQQQLDLFLAWCASDRACTFWSDGRTRQAFDALMARFGDAPINTVSAAQAWVGVLVLLQAGAWTELAQALDDARQGNPAVFANVTAGVGNLMDASMAVSCIDWPLPRDAEWYAKLADELQSTAPDFAGLAAYSGLPCAFWPVPSSRVPGPVRPPGSSPTGARVPVVVRNLTPATRLVRANEASARTRAERAALIGDKRPAADTHGQPWGSARYLLSAGRGGARRERDQEVTRMVARVGDRIVVESAKAGVAPREGVILEVTRAAWGTSYRVSWAGGHESVIRPSAGTVRTTRPREGHPA